MPPPEPPCEVVVEDLRKDFGATRVLRGIDLRIPRGDLVAIVGASGCGKTVLLKHITAHFRPDAGRVLVADHEADPDANGAAPLRDLATLDDEGLDRLRMHWAMVFQRNALLSGSVLENLALWPREIKRWSDERIRPFALRALADVGLDPADVLDKSREELSGGMAKRVAIARALIMDPVLLLYDEPTAGLDPEMSTQIHDLIAATHAAQPALARVRAGVVRTSIIVTHDTQLLQRLRPRVVMLHAGRVHVDAPFEAFAASDDAHIRPYVEQMAFIHQSNR
ncbi:MAG: ATP-binding cassette domain-containing protein [Planctomycetota bacterium]|nr:ATP-binding cassette domain-containing protein [Planctomycetota bacterium]